MIDSKLKAMLISNTKDRGFAFVLALAMGLIMVLASTAAIIRSQGEKIISSTQRETTRALSAAQTGITRYRDLIDKNKIIALYPACTSWNSTTGVCQDGSSTKSWFRASNIPGISEGCPGGDAANIQGQTNRTWQAIDSSDPTKGQYRLIDYSYTSNYDTGTDSYTSQPIGTVTVEGRVNQGGGNIATTRLSIELPIQPGIPPNPSDAEISLEDKFNSLDPALWIGSSSATSVGNLTVTGNILFTNNSCTPPASPTGANVLAVPRALPNTPALPGSYNIIDSDDDTDPGTPGIQLAAGETLPKSSHSRDSNNFYHYLVRGSLTIPNGLNINRETKVILYVQGNITFQGNLNKDPDPAPPDESNSSAYLEIYGNSGTSGSYRYNCASGVTCPTTQVTIAGNLDGNAFIHAPAATVTGSGAPNVNLTGAIWVNNWNTPNFNITITPDDKYFNYLTVQSFVTAQNRIVDPILSTPSSWKTEEVQ